MARKAIKHISIVKNDTIKLRNEVDPKQLFLGEYFNIHTFQMHPITSNFIEREALTLKQWSELETSMLITDFYDSRGYDPRIFYDFVEKYPEFEAAYLYAKRRIGSRRELGAVHKKLDNATIHRTLGHYSDIWREETRLLHEERARFAKQLHEQNESKVVVIERYPNLDENGDIEVLSTSKYTPEQIAANIHRNTGTKRQVKVNADVGEASEE